MGKQITLMEKYFPKKWEDLILPTQILSILEESRKTTGYRLLLYSSPGTGKTSTSRLITLGDENLYLSGSNDFNIDTLRNKVMGFASGYSIMGNQKNVIIDEAENIRDNLQDAFKIILDQCKSVNFIFLTNEVEKMNEAVRSRCTQIDYDFSGANLEEQKQNYIKFILDVCKAENIEYDGKGVKALFTLNFPDFRHVLVNLQQIIDAKETVTFESIMKFAESGKQILPLYEIIFNPAITGKDLYTEMVKFKGKEKDCFLSLGEPFFVWLNLKNLYNKTLDSAIIVSKYSYQYQQTINKFVSLQSCIIELKSIFK